MRLLAILFASGLLSSRLQASDLHYSCSDVSASTMRHVEEYVQQLYRIELPSRVELRSTEGVNPECYRRLNFSIVTPATKKSLTFYLSPDQRFLTGDLLDLREDLAALNDRDNRSRLEGIGTSDTPVRGSIDATVTIAEFSDFQCPSCKRFSDTIGSLVNSDKRVRLVYHHFPLPMHNWARLAAEATACVQQQSTSSFWRLHDSLFADQQKISANNIHTWIAEHVEADKGIDRNTFTDCLKSNSALGIVFRDSDLANAYGIQSTPSIFINGKRIRVANLSDLKVYVDDALVRAADRKHASFQ